MENPNGTVDTKEWISQLLIATQLAEQGNVNFKILMPYLKTDLEVAMPLEVNEADQQAYNDIGTTIRLARSKRTLKGNKIFAYYQISNYIRGLKTSGMKAYQVRQELNKLTGQSSNRTYTIAVRVGQLMDALGPPYLRTFGIISPDLVYRIRKTEWDILCNHAATIASAQTLVEGTIEFTSQELSARRE